MDRRQTQSNSTPQRLWNTVGRAILAVAVLATVLISPGPATPSAEADHGGDHPVWECDGTPLLMRGGKFYDIVPDPATPGELILELIPGTSGLWNSTAHDPTTGYVYGVGNVGGVKHVRAYDANGDVVFQNPIQAPYPQDAGVYAGTVLGDGRYIIHSVGNGSGTTGWYDGSRFNLWSIDPATGAATHIGSTNRNLADIAYNPLDGYIYHIVSRQLYKVDPNTGAYTTTNLPGAFPGGAFGSSWFDAAGFLYVFRNNPGDIFRVDINDPTIWSEVGEVGSDGGTDGTSCVSQIDMKKDVVDNTDTPVILDDRVYAPTDTVTYSYTLINNGLPTMGLTADLCDVLPAGFTYTGVWSSSHVSATLSSGGTNGDGDFCLEVEIPSSLWTDPATPGDDPVVITFDVAIPANATPGEYENQATLDYDQDGDVDLLSDDPGDGAEPRDPTTIQVTGQFTIAKTVVGHPEGNDTDSFAMTVVCTATDTSAITIAATDIVNATTGAAWPGAGAGTFTISHGDTVGIENLPADASCVTTETVPSTYAVAASSSDGTAAAAAATIVVDGAPGTETVSFVNETGVLTITKSADATSTYPIEDDAQFSFDVACDSGFADTYTITTSGGSGSLTYPDTSLLPHDDSCTITETPPAGWANAATDPETVIISSAAAVSAPFNNLRQFADLTVNKSILGLPSSADPDSFVFDVTVECTGGFDPDPYTIPGSLTVSTAAPLVVPDLPVGADCTVTETAVAGFVTTYTPGQTVTITETGATVDITNSTGSLVVRKVTEVVSDLPVDLVETFTFDITCTQGPTTVFSDTRTLTTDTPTDTGAVGGITWGDLPLIPNGSQCTVTELPAAGWTTTVPATGNSIDLVITPTNPEPTAEFTNRRDVASLTLSKTISGAPGAWALDDEAFTADITCTGPFDPSPVVLSGQVVTVNTPLVINGIPTGADCSVTEDADERFTPSYAPANVDNSAAEVTMDDDGESATITNTTSTLSLTKTTTSSSGLDLIADDTFTFSIICVNGPTTVYSGTTSITTSGGTGSAATLDLPLVAPGTECTVTEQGPPDGWSISALTGGAVNGTDTIVATTTAGTNAVAFTNDKDLATLSITKDVTGTPVTPDVADDSFTVNVICTGDFTAGTANFGPLTISEATPATVTDLPDGASCTVTETVDDRFTTSYSPSQTVTVTASPGPGDNTVEVINETATLTVTKVTTAAAGLNNDSTFTFDISCANPAGDVLHTETFTITTVGGTGTWASPNTPLLPIGATCEVAEQTPPAGWTLTSASPVTVTISDTETVDASFTNDRSIGGLTITKTLIGIPDGFNFDDEVFLVDISCTGDLNPDPLVLDDQPLSKVTPLVIPDLPTGAVCTISEDFDSRFQTLYSPDIGDGTASQVTIEEGGTAVGITNAGGTLIVRKSTVVDSDHPIDLLRNFDYDISCSTPGDGTYTLTVEDLAGDEGIGGLTYTELPFIIPDGSVCTVTETVPTGWSVGANPVSVNVSAAGSETASFFNTRLTGDLTIDKQLLGIPAGTDLGDAEFTVDVSCSGGFTVDPYVIEDQTVTANTNLVIEDLPVGAECTVTEDSDPRFTTSYDPSPTATIDADGETVTVTNATSTLAITKATSAPTTHPIAIDGTFTFDVVCTDPGDAELFSDTVIITTIAGAGAWGSPDSPLVPPGTTCTATERAADGWVNSGTDDVDVVTDSAAVATAAFANERETSELTVAKTIIGLPDGFNLDDLVFPVSIECQGDFTTNPYSLGVMDLSVNTPIVVSDLPTGAYCTATETLDDRFGAVYDPDDATALIESGGSSIGIDNVTGTFELDKTIVVDGSHPIDLTASFDFDVTCTNGVVFALTIDSIDGVVTPLAYPDVPLIADGEACTISENTPPSGWSIVGDASQEIIIDFNAVSTVTFSNRRLTGDVAITKAVMGTPAGLDPDSLTFTVDVSCAGDFDTSPLTFDNLDITTTADIAIADLPVGAVCTFVEDNDARFAATYSPANSGGAGGRLTVTQAGATGAIVNSTGEIMIVKITEALTSHPINVTESFDFNVDCGAVHNADYTIATSTALSATSATGALAYDDLPALPNGTSCTVTEISSLPGWSLVSPASVDLTVDATLLGDDAPTATFTNRRDTASLTIAKQLDNVPAGVDLDDETFILDLSCVGTFTTAGAPDGSYDIDDIAFSVNTPAVVPALPTGTSCSITEHADPRFSSFNPGGVSINDDGGTITVTNTTSTLAITKTTSGPSTHPINLDASFDFAVTCTAPDATTPFDGTVSLTTVSGTATWTAPDAPLLVPGTECEITEQAAPGWTNLSDNSQTIITADDAVETATFENQRDTGILTITKTINGLPTGVDMDDELFTVSIVCNGDFAASPYALGPLDLTVNTPVSISDLPTGTSCVATETNDNRFATSYQPADATAIIDGDGETIGIDNTTGTFELAKTVQVDGSQPIDLTATFDFTVSCTNGVTTNPSITSTDGATTPLAYPDIPLVADGETCTITESVVPIGWSRIGDASQNVVIDDASTPTVTFTNQRDTADLTISKAVFGTPSGLDPDTLTFTVDVSCSGEFDSSPLVLNDLTVSNTSDIVVSDLPTGSTCAFAEDVDSRFTATHSPDNPVGPGGLVTVTDSGGSGSIINSTGEIIIIKLTEADTGHPIDLVDTFDFNVDCGAIHNADYTITTSTIVGPTTATGSLGYGDLPALPDGTVCTISETDLPTGWTLTTPASVDLTVDSTLTGASAPTATFTNRRDTGSLTVIKELLNVPDGVDLSTEEFAVDVSCTGQFTGGSHDINDVVFSATTSAVIDRLPTGANCTVVEHEDPRFAVDYSADVTVDDDGEAITVTNTTSTLTITKSTTGPDTHPIDLDGTFILNVICTAPDTSIAFEGEVTLTTVDSAAQWSSPNTPLLVPGTDCTVNEQASEGWTVVSDNPQTAVTVDDDVATLGFVNQRDTGTLSVNKDLVGVPEELDLGDETFSATTTCVGGFEADADLVLDSTFSANRPWELVDLPTGTVCTVDESIDDRFATEYQPVDAAITIGDDPDPEVLGNDHNLTVTNSTATLAIDKITSAISPLDVDVTGNFTFTTTCDNGTSFDHEINVADPAEVDPSDSDPDSEAETAVADLAGRAPWTEIGLQPVGTTCTVTELDPPDGWTLTTDPSVTVELVAGTNQAQFVNSRDTASLVVSKIIEGAPPAADLDDDLFDVTVVCLGDFDRGEAQITGQVSVNSPLELPGIPTSSSCSVTENIDRRYRTTYEPPEAQTLTEETSATAETGTSTLGVVVTDTGAAVDIINWTSSLAITKNVTIDTALATAPNETFTFGLVCDNGLDTTLEVVVTNATSNGGSAVTTYPDVPLIADGSTCTITEQAVPGWAPISETTAEATISSDGVSEIAFTNERQTAGFTVGKQLVDAPQAFAGASFPIEVRCDGDFPDGTLVIPGPLAVGVDSPALVEGIPTGSTCTVTEAPGSDFDVTYSQNGGVITLDHPGTIDLGMGIDGFVELGITNTYVAGQSGSGQETNGFGVNDDPPGTLARTGSETDDLVDYGLLMMLLGFLAMLFGRQRRQTPGHP